MRTKRITQCCEVSKKRESEATDLLLARFENSFLFELLSLIDNQPNLFSFGQCVQTYNECFASTASGFIQRQLNRQLVYAKNSDILPKSQQVRLPSIRSPCSPTSGLPLWSTCLCWGCMSWTWSRRRRRRASYRGCSADRPTPSRSRRWRRMWKTRTRTCRLSFPPRISCNIAAVCSRRMVRFECGRKGGSFSQFRYVSHSKQTTDKRNMNPAPIYSIPTDPVVASNGAAGVARLIS